MELLKPMEIEKQSFATITRELGDLELPADREPIIKRVIHTTADFDYVRTLRFSPDVVSKALAALRDGAHIVTDTNMALAGINKSTLSKLGGTAHCFIADTDVAETARQEGITRAAVSMRKAAQELQGPVIFAIGNAPTALIELDRLIHEGKIDPALIIGVPVGFVHVCESKELILQNPSVPFIVAEGRKGGSNVAAAIVNALLYQACPRESL
ncbi:MAG: precorrin-8X methylmutase [Candidatus Merdivicinus sp.]